MTAAVRKDKLATTITYYTYSTAILYITCSETKEIWISYDQQFEIQLILSQSAKQYTKSVGFSP